MGVLKSPKMARASQADDETWPKLEKPGQAQTASGSESKQPTNQVAARAGMAPWRSTSGLLTAI